MLSRIVDFDQVIGSKLRLPNCPVVTELTAVDLIWLTHLAIVFAKT